MSGLLIIFLNLNGIIKLFRNLKDLLFEYFICSYIGRMEIFFGKFLTDESEIFP
jgi:hypothetical protein